MAGTALHKSGVAAVDNGFRGISKNYECHRTEPA